MMTAPMTDSYQSLSKFDNFYGNDGSEAISRQNSKHLLRLADMSKSPSRGSLFDDRLHQPKLFQTRYGDTPQDENRDLQQSQERERTCISSYKHLGQSK